MKISKIGMMKWCPYKSPHSEPLHGKCFLLVTWGFLSFSKDGTNSWNVLKTILRCVSSVTDHSTFRVRPNCNTHGEDQS
eukprot:1796563-Amphidinium_carterae.1